jgi:low affinity Fe/Cu permease
MNDQFRKFAQKISTLCGSPYAFGFSTFVILIWACLGPIFKYSDTWQLVINTSTTIITFLMVFLIQNTQNRDAKATHLKIDELIHANKHARNQLINLDHLTDDALDKLHADLCELHEVTQQKINHLRKIKPSLHRKA